MSLPKTCPLRLFIEFQYRLFAINRKLSVAAQNLLNRLCRQTNAIYTLYKWVESAKRWLILRLLTIAVWLDCGLRKRFCVCLGCQTVNKDIYNKWNVQLLLTFEFVIYVHLWWLWILTEIPIPSYFFVTSTLGRFLPSFICFFFSFHAILSVFLSM